MRRALSLLTLLLAALVATSANAATITFEDIENNTEFTSVSTQGYLVQANNLGAVYIAEGQDGVFACSPPCAANGTRTLIAFGPQLIPPGESTGYADTVTLTRANGGDFTITGFDAAELFSGLDRRDAAARIDYVGLLDNMEIFAGSVMLDNIIDGPGGLNDFQQVRFPGVTVDTFIFTGMGGVNDNNGFSLDNIVVTDAGGPGPDPSPVPEPGTLALALIGALALTRTRRRR